MASGLQNDSSSVQKAEQLYKFFKTTVEKNITGGVVKSAVEMIFLFIAVFVNPATVLLGEYMLTAVCTMYSDFVSYSKVKSCNVIGSKIPR